MQTNLKTFNFRTKNRFIIILFLLIVCENLLKKIHGGRINIENFEISYTGSTNLQTIPNNYN